MLFIINVVSPACCSLLSSVRWKILNCNRLGLWSTSLPYGLCANEISLTKLLGQVQYTFHFKMQMTRQNDHRFASLSILLWGAFMKTLPWREVVRPVLMAIRRAHAKHLLNLASSSFLISFCFCWFIRKFGIQQLDFSAGSFRIVEF